MHGMPGFRAVTEESLLQLLARNFLIADLSAGHVGQDRRHAVVGQIPAANRGDPPVGRRPKREPC
ncbi:hypothetical protein CKA34_31280 (plasmid) [Rhizobium sp. 11515TR]|nr:hypothetical protein CKA34_31280 [Rhizobium sp. 11515TR]